MEDKKIFSLGNLIWTLPFVGFIVGYALAHLVFSSPCIIVPNLVGSSLVEAVRQLSDQRLNIRILTEKEDEDLPAGTILNQKPIAHRHVKPHHTIYVITSKKPLRKQVPMLLGKHIKEALKELEQLAIAHRAFPLPSYHPNNTVIGQYPSANSDLTTPIKIYYAQPISHEYIFPDFAGLPLEKVKAFLQKHNIQVTISSTHNYYSDETLVKEQRPLAGSLISLKDPPHVQIKV
jgi:eukaryotic-like serine/threonine-protein kinase